MFLDTKRQMIYSDLWDMFWLFEIETSMDCVGFRLIGNIHEQSFTTKNRQIANYFLTNGIIKGIMIPK